MTKLLPSELVTRATYDALAQEWANDHAGGDFWQAELRHFQELLPSGTLLEIGAGGARDAKELVALGYDYIGTDVSTGLLEVARRELPGYPFYEQSVYDLDFGEQKFDGFWASAVLLHIPKSRIDEALACIRTTVAKGAIGFISIKDGSGELQETDEVGGKQLERLFSYWSKGDFTDHLVVNAFRVIDYSFRPMSERTKWHCFYVEAA